MFHPGRALSGDLIQLHLNQHRMFDCLPVNGRLEDAKRRAAASKIQSIARGHSGRRRAALMRQEKHVLQLKREREALER